MCLLFATRADLDRPTGELLSAAYERACDELQEVHHIDGDLLGQLVDTMATALEDLFRAGQRSEEALSRYAVSRALIVSRSSSRFGGSAEAAE